jgi:microcystin-dependent protein
MAEPFLGEIKIFAINFAPKGWALCNGQILAIQQNLALFSLLGTTFGGDGVITFALPDLRGRLAAGQGNWQVGEMHGEYTHVLTASEMPQHSHTAKANDSVSTQGAPNGNFWGRESRGFKTYGTTANTTLNLAAISSTGGSQAHGNQMPSLALQFCIALQGIFPSRN